MKLYNATMDRFIKYISGKDVYIYGLGEYFQVFQRWDIYKQIHGSVAGLIDNGRAGETISVLERKYLVRDTESLKSIDNGIVLICSTKQIDSMYQTLCEERLPDSIECFVLPLLWIVSTGKEDSDIKKLLHTFDKNSLKIDKKIHCFWFSGEEKPKKYQSCIDTWEKICPNMKLLSGTQIHMTAKKTDL